MIIDFHTHAFPPQLANKALQTLSFASGGMVPQTDGTVDGLKKQMTENHIDFSVVLNIATNAKQMRNVNRFAIENNIGSVICFGSVHPDAPSAEEELEQLRENGIKGVKFHPDYQKFFAGDPKMKNIYRKISQLGLITVFHAGMDFGFSSPYHCMPTEAIKMLNMFDSPVVLAHWGGLSCSEEVLKYLVGKEVYFDTSFGYGVMPKQNLLAIVEKHGVDKLLFGTDSPWHTPKMELTLQETLGLSPSEKEKINYLNAKKLLNLNP